MAILVVLGLANRSASDRAACYLAASLTALLLSPSMAGGLLGGWPGALIAQGMFRHKSGKVAFLVPFWLSVIANCAFIVWACSDDGASVIHRLID